VQLAALEVDASGSRLQTTIQWSARLLPAFETATQS
jgi:hypothetical protein